MRDSGWIAGRPPRRSRARGRSPDRGHDWVRKWVADVLGRGLHRCPDGGGSGGVEGQQHFGPTAKIPPRSYFLTLGGDLTIGAGVASFANGTYAMLTGTDVTLAADIGVTKEAICGFIFVLFGLVSIAGGLGALKRMHLFLGLGGAGLGVTG